MMLLQFFNGTGNIWKGLQPLFDDGYQVKPIFGVLAVVLFIVVSLSRVTSFNNALTETTLAIISHTGLAGGIILLGLMPSREAPR